MKRKLFALSLAALLFACALSPAASGEERELPVRITEKIKQIGWHIYVMPGTTVGEIEEFCKPGGFTYDLFEFVQPENANAPARTGMEVYIPDVGHCRTVLMGDPDCDGQITSADARYALRLSVGLEETYEVDRISACMVDNVWEKVNAGKARLILRGSVGLEDPIEWFRAVEPD